MRGSWHPSSVVGWLEGLCCVSIEGPSRSGGGGEAGQARGTSLLAGSASGSCVAPRRDACAPELPGDVCGTGTNPGSQAERGSPPAAREPCWELLWASPLAEPLRHRQHLPRARMEGTLVVVPEQ